MIILMIIIAIAFLILLITTFMLFEDKSILAGIFSLLLTAAFGFIDYLIIRSKIHKNNKPTKSKKKIELQPVPEGYIKTYSFECTGVRYKCKYPFLVMDDRQDIIAQMQIGDLVFLKEYEWEGKPAFAVMSTRYNSDIGVLPAKDVDDILELQDKYDLLGEIVMIRVIGIKRKTYLSPTIELHCYEKGYIHFDYQ